MGTKSRRDAGWEKYRGWDKGRKHLDGNWMRSFKLLGYGIVLNSRMRDLKSKCPFI